MKGEGYVRDIIFLLVIVYFAQGVLYTQGSIISQTVLALVLVLSFYYLFKTSLTINNKDLFYKVWTTLVILNIIFYLISPNLRNPLLFGQFKNILLSTMLFFPSYYFSKKGILNKKHLIRFFILILPLTVFIYFYYRSQFYYFRSDTVEMVNNTAYTFVFLLPYVFLINKKKIISIIAMFILIFFVIQGSKRGALIAAFVGLAFFVYYHLSTIEKSKRLKSYLFVIVVTMLLGYFTYKFYLNNEFLVTRMQFQSNVGEDWTSGRNKIYNQIFNAWYNSDNILNILFGFGFGSSIFLTDGSRAHNDWLELLSSTGILGVIVYFMVFYSAIRLLKEKKWESDKKILLLCILSIWFLTTLFSMNYTSTNGAFQAILLGYLIGSKNKELV